MAVPLSPLHEVIHKQTAKEMIRDKIVSLIASGILQVGDELPSERELATMLMVSRETVRGAVQRLAGEGIVQVSQGARTRIANVNVDVGTQRIGVTSPTSINGYSLDAVHAARLLVETAVVADAALYLSADDIRRLEDSLKAQELAFADPVRFLICDREFHLTIYYASRNRLLADFVVDLYTYMLDHRRIAMGKPGAIGKSLEDHRFIVNALKMRNPQAVSAAFANHILRIHDTSRAVDATAGTKTPRPAGVPPQGDEKEAV
ncbi:FadR/GntR family transcriptional regulator [Labrys monachus]|uniref:DNA-binding FadR family transcriptional regulator n=1 Tax=Labrys monachus TaxID=217067 RepID=A0ABU0FB87_9HYPH|nr:FCD domain-containing protein [Labrys monachus]MDQ0391883.1 DNA-binding FadR family transcriptional regulator [Labrys monachus]